MDKELFDMLNEITKQKLTKEEKARFTENASEIIDKAQKGAIVMTDRGIVSLGRGIDILPVISMCLCHYIQDRLPERKIWEDIFDMILDEAFKDEEDDDDDDDEESNMDEKEFNDLTDKEKLEYLDKLINRLEDLRKNN